MAVLEKFEITPFGPYRFIGKTVYSGDDFGGLWGRSKFIFDAIAELSDYAADETHNVALMTWDVPNNRLCYTVGRFMKPETPVPDGLNHIDVPNKYMARGTVSGEFGDMTDNAPKVTKEAIDKQAEYEIDMGNWMEAEVYTVETIPKDGVHSRMGYYILCKAK